MWACIKVRAYKNDQLAKMASLALDATIIGKKINAYADAQAAMREIMLTHTDKLDALKNLADENMKHFDVLDEGFNGMAGIYGKFAEDIQALRSDIYALKAEFDGTVKDLAEAETDMHIGNNGKRAARHAGRAFIFGNLTNHIKAL